VNDHLKNLALDLRANRGAVLASTLLLIFRLQCACRELPEPLRTIATSFLFPFELVYTRLMLNCEFPKGVTIGGGLKILHPFGIILNDKVTIGSDCQLFHRVTLGTCYPHEELCPMIGNRVIIGTGATILGDVVIPDGTIVRAHRLLHRRNGW